MLNINVLGINTWYSNSLKTLNFIFFAEWFIGHSFKFIPKQQGMSGYFLLRYQSLYFTV